MLALPARGWTFEYVYLGPSGPFSLHPVGLHLVRWVVMVLALWVHISPPMFTSRLLLYQAVIVVIYLFHLGRVGPSNGVFHIFTLVKAVC